MICQLDFPSSTIPAACSRLRGLLVAQTYSNTAPAAATWGGISAQTRSRQRTGVRPSPARCWVWKSRQAFCPG